MNPFTFIKEQCSQSSLTYALLNCRFIVNKTQDLQIELKQNMVDICALTETWIKSDDTITIKGMCPQGYTGILVSRKDKQGGGIALVNCNTHKVKLNSIYGYPTMECADFKLIESGSKTRLAVIYQPPQMSVLGFSENLEDYLESNINVIGKLMIVGDLNIHINDELDPDTIIFSNILEAFTITFPMHILHSTLDLVITHQRNETIIGHPGQGRLFSDHNIVFFDLHAGNTATSKWKIATRKIKAINLLKLNVDIAKALASVDLKSLTESTSVSLYSKTLSSILDNHASLVIKEISDKRMVPGYNDSIAEGIGTLQK